MSDDNKHPLDPTAYKGPGSDKFVDSSDYDADTLRDLTEDVSHECQVCGTKTYISSGTTYEWSWCESCEDVTRHKEIDSL